MSVSRVNPRLLLVACAVLLSGCGSSGSVQATTSAASPAESPAPDSTPTPDPAPSQPAAGLGTGPGAVLCDGNLLELLSLTDGSVLASVTLAQVQPGSAGRPAGTPQCPTRGPATVDAYHSAAFLSQFSQDFTREAMTLTGYPDGSTHVALMDTSSGALTDLSTGPTGDFSSGVHDAGAEFDPVDGSLWWSTEAGPVHAAADGSAPRRVTAPTSGDHLWSRTSPHAVLPGWVLQPSDGARVVLPATGTGVEYVQDATANNCPDAIAFTCDAFKVYRPALGSRVRQVISTGVVSVGSSLGNPFGNNLLGAVGPLSVLNDRFNVVSFNPQLTHATLRSLLPRNGRENSFLCLGADGKTAYFISALGETRGLFSISTSPGSQPVMLADLTRSAYLLRVRG